MFFIDAIIRINNKLYHRDSHFKNRMLSPLRFSVRCIANAIFPILLKRQSSPKDMKGRSEIIVSLTSFPARIDKVWQVIVCMLNQTFRPREIVLWLSKEQFPHKDCIPNSLKNLENDVFKIRIVEGDIKSHKKYYYTLLEYKDDYVFLIDDDLYYPSTMLEKAWAAHINHPNAVICNYGYHISYNEQGILNSYKQWKACYKESSDNDIFFGSGGGTLINLSSLYKDASNINLALKLTPWADDIWLNAMTRLAGVGCYMLANGSLLPIKQSNNMRLTSINNGENLNDIQIHAVEDYYGPLFSHN